MTSDTREVPSVAPKFGTIVNKTKSKNIVNKTKGSVRESCEETTLLKLKIYNTNIIEAVRIIIMIFLAFVKCSKLMVNNIFKGNEKYSCFQTLLLNINFLLQFKYRSSSKLKNIYK